MASRPLAPVETVDRQNWNEAVASAAGDLRLLSPDILADLKRLVDAIHCCKTKLHAIIEAVDAGAICALCGGECCRTGKYHFTVVDLLVYLLMEQELFHPRFGQPFCPYLGQSGCLMSPGFRPFTCVIFNCERVDDLLDEPQREDLGHLEQKLRQLYRCVEKLLGRRFIGGLLMTYENDFARDGSGNPEEI